MEEGRKTRLEESKQKEQYQNTFFAGFAVTAPSTFLTTPFAYEELGDMVKLSSKDILP